MDKTTYKNIDKTLAVICAISSALWLGSTIARYTVAYDIFVPGTNLLRPLTLEVQVNIVRICSNLFGFCISFYSVMVICSVLLGFRVRSTFKRNGYFFMAMILVMLSIPVELYLGYHDWQMLELFPDRFSIEVAVKDVLLQDFVSRFTTLSVFGILSLFSIITAIVFIILQPLKKDSIE